MAGPSTRRLMVAALGLAALFAGWILATPPNGSPDEASSLVRAVAAAEGHWHGRPAVSYYAFSGRAESIYGRSFQIPARDDVQTLGHPCFAFHPLATAGCGPGLVQVAGTTGHAYTGGYFPLPYVPLGAAELLGRTPDQALYLGRAVAALICGGLLLLAFTCLRTRLERLAWIAALLPLTALTATNASPGGFEVCGAVALAAGALATVRGRPGAAPWAVVIGATAVSVAKFSGPVWLVALGALLCLAAGTAWVPRLGRGRWHAWLLPLLGSVANVTWFETAARNRVPGTPPPVLTSASLTTASQQARASARFLFDQLGWQDIDVPVLSWAVGLGAVALVLWACARSRRGQLVVVAAMATYLGGAFGFSLLIQATGFPLQTRYVLALAAPIPLLALTAGGGDGSVRLPGPRVLSATGALLAALTAGAGYVVLRQDAVGARGSWLLHGARWTPPGGLVPTVTLLTVGGALLAAQLAAGRRADAEAPPDTLVRQAEAVAAA